MNLRDRYIQMVAYEEHANGLWLKYLADVPEKPGGAQFRVAAERWLGHICGCYQSWYDWMTDTETSPTGDLSQDLKHQYERMVKFIETCDLHQTRQRSHPDWGTWAWKTVDVIHHTLTHGSYHRGHIRALAEAAGLDDWPDTDWDEFTGWQIKD
ncbi:MAG: hypothetical protein JST12_04860 [Armatimonadetes bacterium]|nr:hypothetical protein [Armatimonadota bacterium]